MLRLNEKTWWGLLIEITSSLIKTPLFIFIKWGYHFMKVVKEISALTTSKHTAEFIIRIWLQNTDCIKPWFLLDYCKQKLLKVNCHVLQQLEEYAQVSVDPVGTTEATIKVVMILYNGLKDCSSELNIQNKKE
jgi:hypothetical protein